MDKLSPESWLISAGRPEEEGGPLNTPLMPASNFALGGERIYSRETGVAGWESLETIIGGLEGGMAIAFSTGMAAAAAVFDQLDHGARIVLPDDCYHGVSALAQAGEKKGYWRLLRLPVADTEAWVDACRDHDLIWLESPSNPLLTVADLEAICAAARKPDALLVVDNTFATPLNQQPLELGADISMHSATKFIGGHSDLLGGVVVSRHPGLAGRLTNSRKVSGATPGTLEVFLAVRGLRTMALRLERAQQNAGQLAHWLETRDWVGKVRYPGLASHPSHDLAARQMKGFGSMISFDVAGGAEAADAICRHVSLIRHATSLGSVETTMERRGAVPGQEHLPGGLLRLSVGIESYADIQSDLERAMEQVKVV